MVAVEAGLVGRDAHPTQQRLPLGVRETVAVPVGACVLAAVIEEADVVVFGLDRLDDVGDELVEVIEELLRLRRYVEVHAPNVQGPSGPDPIG